MCLCPGGVKEVIFMARQHEKHHERQQQRQRVRQQESRRRRVDQREGRRTEGSSNCGESARQGQAKGVITVSDSVIALDLTSSTSSVQSDPSDSSVPSIPSTASPPLPFAVAAHTDTILAPGDVSEKGDSIGLRSSGKETDTLDCEEQEECVLYLRGRKGYVPVTCYSDCWPLSLHLQVKHSSTATLP